MIRRVAQQPVMMGGIIGWLRRRFAQAPFLVLTASGLAPLPAFQFKAMAFAEHYPLGRYLAATAAGRFPRYALLAALGVVIRLPTWVLIALFIFMLLPSVGTAWKRRSAISRSS